VSESALRWDRNRFGATGGLAGSRFAFYVIQIAIVYVKTITIVKLNWVDTELQFAGNDRVLFNVATPGARSPPDAK
jgi:hypothetical protein